MSPNRFPARRRTPLELLFAFNRYALARYRGHPDIYALAKTIEQNLDRPIDALLADQDQAIAAIVDHAYRHSPFYRQKFDAVGFQPGDVKGRADLALLPVTGKLELARHTDQILCLPKDRLYTAATSGTSGIALTFHRDHRCLQFRRGIDLATLRYYGWRDGQWQGWLWGAPRDLLEPSTFKAQLLQHFAERVYYADALHLNTESYRRFARLTRRHAPTWISAYPSLAYDLALRIESGEVEPFRVPMVNLTAEPAYEFQKEKIRATFGSEVCERYGSRESGMAALECPAHAGLHYFTESVYFESLDRGPDTPGHSLIVTDLVNYGMPFIRYDTGDFARIDESPCTCGRSAPRLQDIRGRETDTIWCPDGHGVAGTMVVYLIAQINFPVPIQIVQEAVDRITIRVAGSPAECDSHLAKLIEIYKREISSDIAYHIDYVDRIDRAGSGKYRYVVSHVQPPTVRNR